MQLVALSVILKCSQQHPINQWEDKLYLFLCDEDCRGIVLSCLEDFQQTK